MFEVCSRFIGDFKLGDNVVYNFKLLRLLYETRNSIQHGLNRRLLCKPIILTIASIAEAVLYDLHGRARHHTKEGISHIADDVLAYIRGRKLDEFQKLITSAKKHDLLKNPSGELYQELDILRVVRNRFHIQNSQRKLEENEHDVFTDVRMEQAERTLERILRTMEEYYLRDEGYGFVANFHVPWQQHYPVD